MKHRLDLINILLWVIVLLLVILTSIKYVTSASASPGVGSPVRRLDCSGLVFTHEFTTVVNRYTGTPGVFVLHFRPDGAGLRPIQPGDIRSLTLTWVGWEGTTGVWRGDVPQENGSGILIMVEVGHKAKSPIVWKPNVMEVDWVTLACGQ